MFLNSFQYIRILLRKTFICLILIIAIISQFLKIFDKILHFNFNFFLKSINTYARIIYKLTLFFMKGVSTTMPVAAIYSRKSKFTSKGESTQNQIEMCKEYGKNHFNIKDFIVYEDEGFSGGNTNRPQYQKLIENAKKKKFDVLICYRLDRISRNVLDFSKTIEMLQSNNISFVSIKEQFDTSTPMGRAMMYISSVFAQLERETMGERIKDNMQKLALTGRWLGGKPPFGFKSKQIETANFEGKKRKLFKLIPISTEIEIVKLIYKKYLELFSFTKVESYLIQNNIKRNDNFFNKSTISYILRNPVYCIADKLSFNYFTNYESCISSKSNFNSKNGLIAYSKRDEKNWKVRSKNDWIIGVGRHEGIIESKDWIQAQNIAQENESKSIRNGTSTVSLITPLLKCSCGETMKATSIHKNEDGSIKYFYYTCRRKERTKSSLCINKNLHGINTDKKVIKSLKNISLNNKLFEKSLNKEIKSFNENQNTRKDKKKNILTKIKIKKQSIEKLVESIVNTTNTAASKYIIDKINNIDAEIKILQNDLDKLEENNETDLLQKLNLEIILDLVKEMKNIDKYDFQQKQQTVHRIIDRIVWDGEKMHLYIKGLNFTNSST